MGFHMKPETGEKIRDKLLALSDTERKIVITSPATGEYKTIDVHRNAAGNLEYTYDDVPEA
ncbi:unnamed protein product [marine sediment metagenome]|uniref:Uncharacterized protein n=1 Tax=marine sediment metagenome TaxID=412755 RepID=X1S6L3_9ZZZZ